MQVIKIFSLIRKIKTLHLHPKKNLDKGLKFKFEGLNNELNKGFQVLEFTYGPCN